MYSFDIVHYEILKLLNPQFHKLMVPVHCPASVSQLLSLSVPAELFVSQFHSDSESASVPDAD